MKEYVNGKEQRLKQRHKGVHVYEVRTLKVVTQANRQKYREPKIET
jgi:hypothetical protein